MAPQPQGPMAQDLTTDRNTRRGLGTFSNPDDARSAVFLQFPCEQFHAGVSTWLDAFVATTKISVNNMPIRVHLKTGSLSARLVFETRAKCQDFVARFKDDDFSYVVDCPFGRANASILVRQSFSPEYREFGRRFNPLWEALAPKLQEIFTEKDAKCNFVVPALDVRAQVLSICDRRFGFGKPVFKLAPPGHDQLFDVTALNLCEPYISDVVLQQNFWRSNHYGSDSRGQCVMAALSPPRLFAGFPIWWHMQIAFYLCRRLSLQDQVPYYREIDQTQCSRPYDTLICYFHTAIRLGKCQSILTQTQQSSDHNMFCHRVSPLSVEPLSLGLPMAPPGGLGQL